jgi:hypothetical protein
MNELPNIVRDRLKSAAVGDHPDANLLSAFAEQALPDRDRIQVLEHLARCNDCRDVLALATPLPSTGAVPGRKDTARAPRVSWFGWPVLRWGALAACVVIVGTAVLLQHNLRRSQTSAYVTKDLPPAAGPVLPSASGDVFDSKTLSENAKKQEPPAAASAKVHRKETLELKQSVVASAPVDSTARTAELDLSKKDSPAFFDAHNGASAGAVGGAAAPAPPASTPVPAPRRDEAQNLPVVGRNVVDALPAAKTSDAQVRGANETVQVQSEAVPAETAVMAYSQLKEEAPGKAKAAATPSDAGVLTVPATPTNDKMLTTAAETRASRAKAEVVRNRTPVTRWTISSDGQLQHSVDSGKTWQPVTVADGATFRALSANGPDLWVGGPAGLLYHSSDAGGHWTQIKPAANGATLIADIATIEFTDPLHGKLTTSTGEIWITADAGRSWRKQP